MDSKLIRLSLYVSSGLLLLGLFFYGYLYYQLYTPLKRSNDKIPFEIKRGFSVKQISQALKAQGLIRSRFWFEVEVWLAGRAANFQTGKYFLSASMSIKEIARLLTSPQKFQEEEITLIEGWRREEIAKYLAQKKIIKVDEFLKATADAVKWRKDFTFLADVPQGKSLEGYLFPDTYRIYKETKADKIVHKMLENFDKKLNNKLREEIYKQNKTIYEIITLASIIEKEVKSEEDMKIVAGIFYNRLERGIPLQSDATITFLTGKKDPRPQAADLEIDSPYNTYKFSGLPPGPISNPGLKAIQAAIYPQPSDYMYFLTPPDGSTVFSKTLEEHNFNKRKYLND